jgi:hypothetical protein
LSLATAELRHYSKPRGVNLGENPSPDNLNPFRPDLQGTTWLPVQQRGTFTSTDGPLK